MALPFATAVMIGAFVTIAAEALRWSGTTVAVVAGALIAVLALFGAPLVAHSLALADEIGAEVGALQADGADADAARRHPGPRSTEERLGEPEENSSEEYRPEPRSSTHQLLESELERVRRLVVLNTPDVYRGAGAAVAVLRETMRVAENPLGSGTAINRAVSSAGEDNPREVRDFLIVGMESGPSEVPEDLVPTTAPRTRELVRG
jgi:hypothetical protein